MKPIERYRVVQEIARRLQSEMNTRDINLYVGRFGIEHDLVDSVYSKRAYVEGLLQSESDALVLRIARDLGVDGPSTQAPQTQELSSYFERGGLEACLEDFRRASSNVETDPDQALASASSTLESVCRTLLEKLNVQPPADLSMQPLLRAVFDAMELSPERHADPDIKRILGGLFNAGAGIGTLRTKYSAAHGHGESRKRLTHRHARLAVNAAATVSLFLLETWHERFLTTATGRPTRRSS